MLPNRNKTQAVHLDEAFIAGADMSAKEGLILAEVVGQTGFKPEQVLQRSSYWGTGQIGAVHYSGRFENKLAVLKIQGVKPDISEIFMIQQFIAQNRSRVVRPPILYATIPWEESRGYEALIMERVTGDKVLQSKKLQPRENVVKFFEYYQEYRRNCLPSRPWLPKPESLDPRVAFEQLVKASQRAYPEHPFRKPEDNQTASAAVEALVNVYANVPLEFVQSHFSVEDLIYQGDNVVLFSNLFWKWRYPFYDAVFGYHWFMYELANVQGISSQQVESQRSVWMDVIFGLPQARESAEATRLVKAALLERATAGFLIDSFLMDTKKPISEYLNEATRKQVQGLTDELT